MNKILHGDSLIKLKELEDNSVDSIVTDPPYGLSFMGKKWDYDVPSVEIWKECLRILKPGGYLLSFAGTRTQHRMAVNIEDAGFEIRDMIAWIYGSGFPKSLNIGKSVNQLETNEWSKIGKALDNINKKNIIEVWKSNSDNVKIVETQSLKNQIIAGKDTLSENFVVLNVAQNNNQESLNLLVSFVEQNLNEVQAISTKTNTALQNVEIEIRQLQNLAKSAEQLSQGQNHRSWNIFTAQCDVKEFLNENTDVSHKVDEALKTLRGNKKYSNEEITSVLCAGLTDILKLTILNQSKTFQNLDTNQKMECVSAINVIITEYTAENLISNTVDILKSKAVDKLQGNERNFVGIDKSGSNRNCMSGNFAGGEYNLTKGTSEWEGWGTALKPALEPITLARKPLEKGLSVAENCLKWGVGGINIDECRVGTDKIMIRGGGGGEGTGWGKKEEINEERTGRFPANLIHDNSEEVRECFPETKSKGHFPSNNKKGNSIFNTNNLEQDEQWLDDSGNASRFFKSIIYQAKASKSERNKGCEGLEEKDTKRYGDFEGTEEHAPKLNVKNTNNHPTVKPIALMEYLIKMVTPKGGIVLDPFAGSGSTLVAAKQNGFNYIGIELTEEYLPIIEARLNSCEAKLF